MSAPTPRRLSTGQRIAFVAGGVGAFLIALVIGSWYVLPVIAPQFVIRNSPWVDPIIRAEVFETGGIDTYTWDPSKPPPPKRMTAYERINDDDLVEGATASVIAALSDPDVRVRRVALQMLEPLLEYDADEFFLLSPAMLAALYPLLQDADEYVFRYTFDLLLKHNSDETAQHIFDVLPRACDPKKLTGEPDDVTYWGYFFDDSPGTPRTLRILSRLDLVALTKPWLATNEQVPVARALLTLSYSHDPAIYEICADYLGRAPKISQRRGTPFDPAEYALKQVDLKPFVQTICDILAGTDQKPRRGAARLVIEMNPDGDAELRELQWNLIRAYRNDSNSDVSMLLGYACGKFLTVETITSDLIPILEQGGPPVVAAIGALSGYDTNLVQRPRPWHANHSSPLSVKLDIPWDKPGNPELVTAITTVLSHYVTSPDVEIRRAAARYMNLTWEAETVDAIKVLARDADAEVRKAVAWSVDDIKDRTFKPAREEKP